MYFLILLWGHERRQAAALKFFLFTQAGGLAMLAAILALYFLHGRSTGQYTFDALKLVGHGPGPRRRALDPAGLRRRLRRQAARRAPAPLAARRPHPGAHRRQRAPGRPAAEDRGLRPAALRAAPVPLRGAQLAPVLLVLAVAGILYGALHGRGAERPEAPGGLHQHQPHGLRAAGHRPAQPGGPAGGGRGDAGPRPGHGGAVHPGRVDPGPAAHPGPRAHGRVLGAGAPPGPGPAVLLHGLPGAPGPGQLRRGVPQPPGRLAAPACRWPCLAPAG